MLPTPPIKIALATPVIFPIPKVPAKIDIKDLISVLSLFFMDLKYIKGILNTFFITGICGNFNFILKYIPKNINILKNGIFHIALFNQDKKLDKFITLKIVYSK